MSDPPRNKRNRIACGLAVLTAVCIFPLILVGAGVTTKDAGMVFPDWPTSDGAILNPPGWLQDSNKTWEHGHRLIGWTVGVLAIASVVAAWRLGTAARRLTLLTLCLIIVQGLLGGLRVTEVSRTLAMIHGIWGQMTFCVAALAALALSGSWAGARPMEVRGAKFYQIGTGVCLVAVLIQLLLGAWYRHFAANSALIAHVLWAIVVFLILSWLTMWTLEQYSRLQPLSFLGKSLAVLIALQMVLGGAAFLIRVMGLKGSGFITTVAPSAHVAVGALMLACTALIAVSALTRLTPAFATAAPMPASTVTT